MRRNLGYRLGAPSRNAKEPWISIRSSFKKLIEILDKDPELPQGMSRNLGYGVGAP
jgi:hypothetical protein